MYCWDRLWSLPPSLTRAVAQGIDPPDSDCEWVPCGVFHHGGSLVPLTERVRRLAVYWWWTLPFMHRGSLSGQGWLRAPWVSQEQAHRCDCPVPAPGPIEEAWTEIDGQMQDPELDWI
jgi:hypothetical protein